MVATNMPEPDEPGSVTGWYFAFRRGDTRADSWLFRRFFGRMLRRVRGGIGPALRSRIAGDEEDLAMSAIHSFFGVIRDGDERDRDRRALDGLAHQILRRKLQDRLALKARQSPLPLEDLGTLAAAEMTPEVRAEASDLLTDAMAILDATDREIAHLHLNGDSTSKIAEQVGLSKSSVALRVRRIVKTWQRRYGVEAA